MRSNSARQAKDLAPAYVRIAGDLRNLIESGELAVGAALPSERALCQQYGVSRMTLRQACGLLESDGLIERRRGSGTFVAPKKIRKRQQEMRGFTEDIRARGGKPSSRLLGCRKIEPDAERREFFGISHDDCVHEIERLRLNDGMPLAVEKVSVPCYLCPNLDRFDLETQSLYTILEEHYGLTLAYCSEEITALPSNARLRRLLEMPASTPLLAVQRRTFTADDTPVEFASTIYRGDLYSAIVRSVRAR